MVPLASYSLHFNAFGFPKRWGKPDCYHYMTTGICGHGLACMFHHPEPIFYYPYQGNGYSVGCEVVGYQNRYAQLSNRWNQRHVTITIKEPCVTLNDIGLPLRPEKEACRYYENTGYCRYGRGCKFDHPLK
ncbi:putative transcription factor C3H family [Helianthus annuus]|uniref:Transcription factor C3H family n=2 Tax=Helianthus annuus TaxID=4232 RepID=A0A9K3GU00_HELAN|nr:putative transcription factor C3H family [Helianthus annuus]KAJ0428954.1 putative transcription factor C3H family [Helianthus annuus]KAJ0632426.1 putative transcription factor C3H family [Helianthus annuus]KAJ0812932.1 putative transcription factor C3H family [Helianthus annuus]